MSKQKVQNKIQDTVQQGAVISFKELQINRDGVKRIAPAAFSTWVRVLLQNWRQGTVACKGRADVAYSNKKPWKQKGTGRARAGSRRSPLWRGGGVIFGPQMRTRTLALPKKIKKQVLQSLASDYLDNNKVVSLDWSLTNDVPKTAQAYSALKNAGLIHDRIVVFLTIEDHVHCASFANLPNVQVLFFDQPNAFHLAKCDRWVFLKKDFDRFKEMVTQWT